MKQFEGEYESRLADLDNDSRSGCVFVYTELALHFFFGSDFEVRDRVNGHAGFWNGVLGALQSAGFIALGRMYDRDRSDGTIDGLLTFAEHHPGIFQPTALEARRIRAGVPAQDARAFAAGAYVLGKSDLSPLRVEFQKQQAVYAANAEKIRHGIFAHAGRLDRAERDRLFTGVFLRDLEAMAVFPLQLHRALWGLYVNGQTPVLELPPTNTAEIIDRHLPGERHSTWEHLHAVKNVGAFVDWMKLGPVPPETPDNELIARLRAAMESDHAGRIDEQPTQDDENGNR